MVFIISAPQGSDDEQQRNASRSQEQQNPYIAGLHQNGVAAEYSSSSIVAHSSSVKSAPLAALSENWHSIASAREMNANPHSAANALLAILIRSRQVVALALEILLATLSTLMSFDATPHAVTPSPQTPPRKMVRAHFPGKDPSWDRPSNGQLRALRAV